MWISLQSVEGVIAYKKGRRPAESPALPIILTLLVQEARTTEQQAANKFPQTDVLSCLNTNHSLLRIMHSSPGSDSQKGWFKRDLCS